MASVESTPSLLSLIVEHLTWKLLLALTNQMDGVLSESSFPLWMIVPKLSGESRSSRGARNENDKVKSLDMEASSRSWVFVTCR